MGEILSAPETVAPPSPSPLGPLVAAEDAEPVAAETRAAEEAPSAPEIAAPPSPSPLGPPGAAGDIEPVAGETGAAEEAPLAPETVAPPSPSPVEPLVAARDIEPVAAETVDVRGMRFHYIPAGEFSMGSPVDEEGRGRDENLHQVMLSRGYWIGETEVTQGQWTRLLTDRDNPSFFTCEDCPVEDVSWNDAIAFVNALSVAESLPPCYTGTGPEVQFEGLDCEGFRLPTEAEWERAARAGTQTTWYFGERQQLDEHTWFDDNARVRTHRVGQKEASPWGLSDVYGNVWEWCFDWYGPYPDAPQTDPVGPQTG
jgi:formylglycine-generating enzyme required for sulfatase activity